MKGGGKGWWICSCRFVYFVILCGEGCNLGFKCLKVRIFDIVATEGVDKIDEVVDVFTARSCTYDDLFGDGVDTRLCFCCWLHLFVCV